MKPQSTTNALLWCISTASAAHYASVNVDTWCITYLSTYLAPVSIKSASSPPPFPTCNGTCSQTTDVSTTQISSTASPTSTGTVVPPGRSIILQIEKLRNRKRDTDENIRGGFVRPDNPDVCTFATIFTVAEDQLYDNGVPRFYSVEGYKVLLGEDPPMRGSITRTVYQPPLFFKMASYAYPPQTVESNRNAASQCQNGQIIGANTLTNSKAQDFSVEETTVGLSSENSIAGVSTTMSSEVVDSSASTSF
ncbi:hypothetical protein FSHL1_005230 [Fusarium sambucinum]